MKKIILPIVTSIGLVVTSAKASSITYATETGTAYQTPLISAFNTYGNEMAGMQVWVNFSNGTTEEAIWDVTGEQSGAAKVSGYFSISETGDTFDNSAWTLENLNATLSITSFTMLGVEGNTLFDRTFGGLTGTPGSELGKDFEMGGNYSITATYSDILNLTGSAPVGDVYEELTVAFNSSTEFTPFSTEAFTQDTDNAAVSGSITPTPTVPDGASTAMLLGIGLTALAALKRRFIQS